jgi:hypothetical protein
MNTNSETTSNVCTGQVYKDTDTRRAGRTFKVVNIDYDDNLVTCQNLTRTGGKAPLKGREVSFIKLSRLVSSRQYKMVADKATTIINNCETPVQVKKLPKTIDFTILKRKPKQTLLTQIKNIVPGQWSESGPYCSLMGNNNAELLIRQTQEHPAAFEYKIMYNRFCLCREVLNVSLKLVLEQAHAAIYDISKDIVTVLKPFVETNIKLS